MVRQTQIPGALCLLEWRGEIGIRTPGGALTNTARSFPKPSSGGFTVKPQRVSLIRDSLVVASGTTRDVILDFTKGLGADDCSTHFSVRAKLKLSTHKASGWALD